MYLSSLVILGVLNIFQTHGYVLLKPLRTPILTHLRTSRLTDSQSLTSRIIRAVKTKFPEPTDNARVLDCFQRFATGDELNVEFGPDPHNKQKANCWVKGLTTLAFHDVNNGKFQWALDLERNSKIVSEELQAFLAKEATDTKWLGPRFQGQHYGPEWRTLGLQDRGVWDGENVESFPNTVKLLSDIKTPSCEVFFARQGPKSGINPHSDLNNFILTAHLAVDVPKNASWIRVGDETKYWENGKTMVFDTSIFHSTRNEADTDRFVLLIRFWHPDLTEKEVDAFTFIFDFLDHANLGDEALYAFEMEHVVGLRPQPTSSLTETRSTKQSTALSREQRRKLKADDSNASKATGRGFHRGK